MNNKCGKYIYCTRFKNYFGYYSCTSGKKWYNLKVIKWALKSYIVTDILRLRYLPDGKGKWIKKWLN